MNVSGPGDYTLPDLWGSKPNNYGRYSNAPAFSMASRSKNYYLTKEYSRFMQSEIAD